METVKLAEDDESIILRAREAYGATAHDAISGPLAGAVEEISPMEDQTWCAPASMDYRPFEIKTLRLRPAEL